MSACGAALGPGHFRGIESTIHRAGTVLGLNQKPLPIRTRFGGGSSFRQGKEGINIDLKNDFIGLKQVAMTDTGVRIFVRSSGSANILLLNRPAK